MKVGEIFELDSREETGSTDTWTEYLCLEKLKKGFELTIRGYDILGQLSDYTDDDGNENLPDEINGEKISNYDNEYIYGSNLVINADDDGSVKFINPNEDDVRDWLESIEWFEENIISDIEEIIK